jgi:hypothetical protein
MLIQTARLRCEVHLHRGQRCIFKVHNGTACLDGVCGIGTETADVIRLVQLLSGAAGQRRNPAEITTMACKSLSTLSATTALSVALFCAGDECPLPVVVTGRKMRPLALHPSGPSTGSRCYENPC